MKAKKKLKYLKNYGVKSEIEKYMKTKLNSDEKLHLNKTIEILSKTIVAGAIFTKRTNIMHNFS